MVEIEKKRLSRNEWLAMSLDILASEGMAALSLNKLISRFHVTKGSFYWHFDSYATFQEALADYWHIKYTADVPDAVGPPSAEPAAMLRELLRYVIENDLAKYDAVMTTFVMRNPAIGPKVSQSFDFRMKYVRQLYVDMGYRGRDATMRARIYVAYATAEPLVNAALSKKQRVAQISQACKFLVPAVSESA